MRGAYASRTGSRASAGASAKKTWKSSFLSCKDRLGSQSAAITASNTAWVSFWRQGQSCCGFEVSIGCKEICLRYAMCQFQKYLLV